MAECVIRLMDHQSMTVQWWAPDDLDVKEIQQGSLQACAANVGGHSLTLLLPAADVILLTLDLPIKSPQQLKKAMPYALEEWLADEVDTYHTVWHRDADALIHVAAINAEKFNTVLAQFQAAGLPLTAIYSEVLALPYKENTLSVLIEAQKIVLRTQRYLGGGFDQDSLVFVLEKWLNEHATEGVINCWSTLPLPECITRLANEGIVHVIRSENNLLQPHEETEGGVLNLLTRDFQPKKATDLTWKKWLPALSVFSLTVLLQFGVLIHSAGQKKQELAKLESQVQALFKDIFPEITRIVNIKAQTDQQLSVLKQQGASNGSSFMTMLYQIGQVLSVNPDIKLKKLDFMNNALQLHFTAQDLAKVDQVKQQLESAGHLIVTIKSVESKQVEAEVDFEIKQK